MNRSERIIRRKIPQGANRLPMILSFKRHTNDSISLPMSQITLDLSEKMTFDNRIQTFTFQKHSRLNLLRGLPYQKYSKKLIQDPHFQVHIIEEELKLLYEKFKLLKSKLMETITVDSQQMFNAKLEETLALGKEICRIILFEYANFTNELNIKQYPYLIKNSEVKNELWALEQNYIYLSEATDAFKGAFAAYKTLARQKDRDSFPFPVLIMLFQFLARARLNLSELNEEIAFTESFNTEKSKILENMLNLHSVHEILHVTPDTVDDLRQKAATVRDDINTSKTSKEIIQGIYDNRLYQNMIRGSVAQNKSNFFTKIMNSQRSQTIQKNLLHSSTEYALRADREEAKHSFNSPYFFRNISNIYSKLNQEKIRRKNYPKPSNPYFPDRELRKAIKLGKQIKNHNNS